MAARYANEIELPALALPMVIFSREPANKILPVLLLHQKGNCIFPLLRAILRLRIVPHQHIHQPAFNFVLEKVDVCGVVLDDACIDNGDLIDFPLQNLFDFYQFVKEPSGMNPVDCGCPCSLQNLLAEHCCDGIACEILRHSPAAVEMLLGQVFVDYSILTTQHVLYFIYERYVGFIMELLHRTAHEVHYGFPIFEFLQHRFQVFDHMNPRVQVVEFQISLCLDFLQCPRQCFNLISNDADGRGALAGGVKEKLEQLSKVKNTLLGHHSHTEQNQSQVLVLPIEINHCILVSKWSRFTQNLIIYLQVYCLSILQIVVLHAIGPQVNQHRLFILRQPSDALTLI